MISREDLGSRIRTVRKEQGMTLKELERRSGFSATHISEIERGKTSPTIGALIRVAGALEKDASFFLEEEHLSEVAFVRRDARHPLPKEESQVRGEYLTPGIPGGRLNAYMLYLEPGGDRDVIYDSHAGEEGAYLLEGDLEYQVGTRTFRLGQGDAIHHACDRPHGFRNVGGGSARILVVSTRRIRRNNSSSGTTGRAF